jgi:hypothetical protein
MEPEENSYINNCLTYFSMLSTQLLHRMCTVCFSVWRINTYHKNFKSTELKATILDLSIARQTPHLVQRGLFSELAAMASTKWKDMKIQKRKAHRFFGISLYLSGNVVRKSCFVVSFLSSIEYVAWNFKNLLFIVDIQGPVMCRWSHRNVLRILRPQRILYENILPETLEYWFVVYEQLVMKFVPGDNWRRKLAVAVTWMAEEPDRRSRDMSICTTTNSGQDTGLHKTNIQQYSMHRLWHLKEWSSVFSEQAQKSNILYPDRMLRNTTSSSRKNCRIGDSLSSHIQNDTLSIVIMEN